MVRVLLVDDSRIDRTVLRRNLLQAMPLAGIAECATLAEARQVLKGTVADIVIADERLPDGRGSELLSDLGPEVIKVLVSGEDVPRPEGTRFLCKEALSPGGLSQTVSDAEALSRARVAARPLAGDCRRELGVALTRAIRLLRSGRLLEGATPAREQRDRLIQIEAILLAARDSLE